MTANGEHQGVVKAPPTPSPLRFSKFFQSNMRILVTGGAGFIGSHLVDKLIENEKNETIKTNVMGILNMLGLTKRVEARILLTSTSEVYGDPLEHPQKEKYWGNVNPIDQWFSYTEGKGAIRMVSTHAT